ncbi:HlyD family secretion protein [Paracoccus aestuariivivens]|uniref:HlyD family efflux transporter periplasmic adaptor subunit n=1 Tax=Paracoccus aestuariivivens TaxID=1820333 RepID=A0A6L6J3Z0_9RHOB|nr:HlyD family secretion protein [Paracoccus aestuariivivens]MTH76812.1 HlyD family efflux transporter periplasmic adaptor subunit [Paracoccus aestuariivivens]
MAVSDDKSTPDQKPASKGSGGKAKRVLSILGILVLSVAGYEGWHWYSFGRFHQETDDAYLQADLIQLQARVTGYVSEIMVEPNAPVAKGQVIARIDPEDYQLALERARNSLATAKSAENQLQAQITAAHASIAQAEASVAAAEATNDGAQKSFRRANELKSSSAGTQAALDAAEATAKSTAAQVQSAKAAFAQSQAELTVLNAKVDSAAIETRSAETAVRQAQRDLGFTEIRAAFDGVLTERQVETGSFVTTGSRIGTLVPVNKVYVEANFKETQIASIHPGAEVSVRVDAWPKEVLHGTVVSMTAGTGQVFSLLPASNATGNFTKVVQRVPVRIEISDADRERLPLRPGMSVISSVDTRTGEATPLVPAYKPESDSPTEPQGATISESQHLSTQKVARTGG